MALINGRVYEWADITVLIGGADITGIRGIKYDMKAERENVYAKGRLPYAVQTGNYAPEGSVTIMQPELDALVKAGKGNILSLSVDIIVAYGNPAEGNYMTTDRIVGARFESSPKEMKQGDKFMEIELSFKCLNIIYQYKG